jgi:hypothetical protein
MQSRGFRLSNITEKGKEENVPGYEELAGGITLLVWVIASSVLLGGMSQSSAYDSMFFVMVGLLVILILTPFGAVLFAKGLGKILKKTRS